MHYKAHTTVLYDKKPCIYNTMKHVTVKGFFYQTVWRKLWLLKFHVPSYAPFYITLQHTNNNINKQAKNIDVYRSKNAYM